MTPQRFGPTLRALIARDFPSQAAFARAIGLSAARVNQLVTEADEALSYAVLAEILEHFDANDQVRLYEGWLTSHAPPPSSSPASPRSDDEIDAALELTSFRLARGEAPDVAKELQSTFSRLKRQGRTFQACKVAQVLAEILFAIDRRSLGVALAEEMLELLEPSHEPMLVAHALRLKVVGLRPVRVFGTGGAADAVRHYQAFLDRADHQGDPQAWINHTNSLARETALIAWELSRRGRHDDSFVEQADIALAADIAKSDQPTNIALGLEVGTRLALIQGDVETAERRLSKTERLSIRHAEKLNTLKFATTRVRLAAARGDRDEAIAQATGLLEEADAAGLLHYHRELSDLLANLVLRRR